MLPMIWVIEALASSRQVDASVLLELYERTPKISEDIGRNARESMSLRILESLFAQGPNVNSVSCNAIPKIRIDPSELCDDVLRRILTETCASNLKRPEMWKWDVQPFLEHKRASLPKYSLGKLKDTILSQRHPSIASLKEHSGLSVGKNQIEHGALVEDGKGNGAIGSKPKESVADGKGKRSENFLPVNRKRKATIDNARENSCKDLILLKDVSKTNVESVKKHKHNIILDHEKGVVGELKSASMDLQFVAASKLLMQYKERQLSGSVEKSHNMVVDEPSASDDEPTLSKWLEGTDDEVLPCEDQVPRTDGESNRKYAEEREGHNDTDEAKDDREGIFNFSVTNKHVNNSDPNGERGNAQNVGEGENVDISADVPDNIPHVEHGQTHDVENAQGNKKGLHEFGASKKAEKEIYVSSNSDSDSYHHERNAVVAKKKRFLSSQCPYSQDSPTAIDWIDLNLCVKCNKGGNLLICSSDSCSLVIHDKCLGSDVSFDTRGEFYCPFCAYSRAITKYTKIKKKASLARKELAAFISKGRGDISEKEGRSCRTKENILENVNDLPKLGELNTSNVIRKPTKPQNRKKAESERGEPSIVRSNNPHLGKKPLGSSCELTDETLKRKGLRSQLPTGHRQDVAAHGENASRSCEGREKSVVTEKQNRISSKKGVDSPQAKDLVHRSKSSPIKSTEDKGKSAASKYPTRTRKQERDYTYPPPLPEMRRKRVPWTTKEEEILMEGVERYSDSNSAVPWKIILDFGADVFHEKRTAVDLKDKWRKMCKAAASQS